MSVDIDTAGNVEAMLDEFATTGIETTQDDVGDVEKMPNQVGGQDEGFNVRKQALAAKNGYDLTNNNPFMVGYESGMSTYTFVTPHACDENDGTATRTLLREVRPPFGQTPKTSEVCLDAAIVPVGSIFEHGETFGETQLNQPRLQFAFIAGASEDMERVNKRIVPAMNTWLAEQTFSVVFANTNETVSMLGPFCGGVDKIVREQQKPANLKSWQRGGYMRLTCGNPSNNAQWTAVLTDCPNDNGHDGEYGAGPCCKFDRFLLYAHFELHEGDWFFVSDDDVHVDKGSLQELLQRFEANDPLIVSADGSMSSELTADEKHCEGTGLHKWNKHILSCLDCCPQGFYYAVLSRGLLTNLVSSVSSGGLAYVCNTTGAAYERLWACLLGCMVPNLSQHAS